jgi:hypothetical protein
VLDALAAAGPHRDHADQLMLFGQFVGSWDFDGFYTAPDGARVEMTGEWHFGWVLAGRAIQDVLICPPRDAGGPNLEYGSTIRFYDPAIDAWQITWITPPQRAVVRLVARPVGDEIVLEGPGSDGLLRWTFSGISPDAFTWRGFHSTDDGASWRQREEMRLRRANHE